MTKADLVEKVTAQIARTAGPLISKKDCARVVDSFLDAVKAALAEQHNIEVRGFGTFKIRQRKTRMARNPRTGDPVEVAARPVPVFKPSKELRDRKSTRLNSSHLVISYAVFCLKKKKQHGLDVRSMRLHA